MPHRSIDLTVIFGIATKTKSNFLNSNLIISPSLHNTKIPAKDWLLGISRCALVIFFLSLMAIRRFCFVIRKWSVKSKLLDVSGWKPNSNEILSDPPFILVNLISTELLFTFTCVYFFPSVLSHFINFGWCFFVQVWKFGGSSPKYVCLHRIRFRTIVRGKATLGNGE